MMMWAKMMKMRKSSLPPYGGLRTRGGGGAPTSGGQLTPGDAQKMFGNGAVASSEPGGGAAR